MFPNFFSHQTHIDTYIVLMDHLVGDGYAGPHISRPRLIKWGFIAINLRQARQEGGQSSRFCCYSFYLACVSRLHVEERAERYMSEHKA